MIIFSILDKFIGNEDFSNMKERNKIGKNIYNCEKFLILFFPKT